MFNEYNFHTKSIETEEEKKRVKEQRTALTANEGERYQDYRDAGAASRFGEESVEFDKKHHEKTNPEDELYVMAEEYEAQQKRVEIEQGLTAISAEQLEISIANDRAEKLLVEAYEQTLDGNLGISPESETNTVDPEARRELEEKKNDKILLVAAYIAENKLFSSPSRRVEQRTQELRFQKLDLKEQYAELAHSPEGYYSMEYHKLNAYREALMRGEMVETPSTKLRANELTERITIGQPVFLAGDLGSGKTEMARHVVKTRFGTAEPYLVSMRRDMDPGDYVGRNQLEAKKVLSEESKEEFATHLLDLSQKRFAAWRAENPEADVAAQASVRDQIREQLNIDYKNSHETFIETKFVLGQMYRAMEEGTPLIMDEINAAPHEVLISLNDYLTRRPGDTIRVQQDGGREIEIKPGFAFVFTGNLGARYESGGKRQEMDAAFLSRLHRIDYDYPKQITDVSYSKYLASKKELNNLPFEEFANQKDLPVETFEIMVAMLMEDSGTSKLSPEEFEQVFNLAKAARLLQDNFSGKETDANLYHLGNQGNGADIYRLKKSVPSIRNLIAVIDDWKKDNFVRPLDYFLYNNFIKQASVPTDRAYMTAFFREQGGFFSDEQLYPEVGDLVTSTANGDRLNESYSLDLSAMEEMNGTEKYDQSLASISLEKKLLASSRNKEKTHGVAGPRKIVEAVYGEGPEARFYGTAVNQAEITQNQEANEIENGLAREGELTEIVKSSEAHASKFAGILQRLEQIAADNECPV